MNYNSLVWYSSLAIGDEKNSYVAFKEQQEKVMEQQRLEYNRRTAQKQQRLVHWCNAYDQGNYLNIHSEEYRRKTEKINKTRSYY